MTELKNLDLVNFTLDKVPITYIAVKETNRWWFIGTNEGLYAADYSIENVNNMLKLGNITIIGHIREV